MATARHRDPAVGQPDAKAERVLQYCRLPEVKVNRIVSKGSMYKLRGFFG